MVFEQKLDNAKDLTDIFELVKKTVYDIKKGRRSGIMLGLADLGAGKYQWIGGYHVLSSNSIIMNSRPLDYIKQNNPSLLKPYEYVILLHEYLHTLGIINEQECRDVTHEICLELFGFNHLVTNMAKDMTQFLPYIQTAEYGWEPPQDLNVYYIRGFDRSSTSYII
ncbi:MAG: hypothetical protein EU530_08510 [Promethearchaeota archaeon]|nr:MAG: hypothetical protein EU530_08510 [Candidatus Lokiarchaeota archaeon]